MLRQRPVRGASPLGALFAASVATLALTGLTLAATVNISANPNSTGFTRNGNPVTSVTITTGDTVVVSKVEGSVKHNLRWDDEPDGCPSQPTTAAWVPACERTFDAPGTYVGFCEIHTSMRLTVTVNDPATPSPTKAPTAAPTKAPTAPPTNPPSKPPTAPPTKAPTPRPTALATPQVTPSTAPTAAPTAQPTTLSTTAPESSAPASAGPSPSPSATMIGAGATPGASAGSSPGATGPTSSVPSPAVDPTSTDGLPFVPILALVVAGGAGLFLVLRRRPRSS